MLRKYYHNKTPQGVLITSRHLSEESTEKSSFLKLSNFLIHFENFMRFNVEIQVWYTEIPKEKPETSCLYD